MGRTALCQNYDKRNVCLCLVSSVKLETTASALCFGSSVGGVMVCLEATRKLVEIQNEDDKLSCSPVGDPRQNDRESWPGNSARTLSDTSSEDSRFCTDAQFVDCKSESFT
jgi:hypothetical protein